MSFDGNGNFNQATAPVVSGTVISSTNYNTQNADFAAGLTNTVTKDGQTNPTANLKMAGFRHTGVGNAVARTDYAAMGQVQDGAGIWCGTAGGTANALTLTPSPAIPAYAAGQVFRFTAGASPNSGATTVAVSGLTAQAVQGAGSALAGGEIQAGRQYTILYDGTNFQLLGLGTATFYNTGTSAGNVVRLDGSARLPAVDGSQLTGVSSAARSGVKNLTGANNSGTPNTQYDFAADEVLLTNGAGGFVLRTATGTITNNVSTAGSTANGRDQAGAFSAGSWVHFYFIWNGTTLATLSSASATAPTLPSGYTHRAYIGAVYFNGSSQLLTTRFRGSKVFYAAAQSALSAGTATVETSVSLTALIPPNALTAQIYLMLTVAAGGASGQSFGTMRIVAGSDYHRMEGFQQAGLASTYETASVEVPNLSQAVLYITGDVSGSGAQSMNINVQGYTVPNGDS